MFVSMIVYIYIFIVYTDDECIYYIHSKDVLLMFTQAFNFGGKLANVTNKCKQALQIQVIVLCELNYFFLFLFESY